MGGLCQNFSRESRIFSKWARHWGDVGTKTGFAQLRGKFRGGSYHKDMWLRDNAKLNLDCYLLEASC
ncbi:hypothetical protein Prudu_021248 [Prunus dulcis]|uniref:Uncharacterized protein n=1 Tax=Prunus dulcis TaxID=3755 RepID=A0A4Y1RYN1_PRUDU|nr:hypothetical protein Prudu_021248 [Prunus dulcis]